MAAAAARLRLSARPRIGIRTRASARAARSAGTPRASLPKSHSTGPVRRAPSPSRVASPPPSAASTVTPAPRSAGSSSSSGAPRTTSTWKTLPALARTAFPPKGSADPAPNTTAPAPHASAVRRIVPAFPGSASSAIAPDSVGGAAATASAGTSRGAHTATSPWGVTVSDSPAAAFSVTTRTGTSVPASRSRCAAAAASVANTSRTPSGSASASRTAWRPSARNSPAASRPDRRVSLRAAAIRPDFSVSSSMSPPRTDTDAVGDRSRGPVTDGVGGVLLASGSGVVRRGGGDGGARGLHQGGEGGRLVHGELGQDTTVQLDAGQLEALHEPVVGHVVEAGRGVDPGDPQLAEVTLARLAVAVGVRRGVENLLLGLAVQPGPLAAVAAGGLEGGAALLLGVDRPLDACHGSAPVFWSVSGGQRPSSFFMRGASAGDSTPMPLTRRLREDDFTSNLCWLLVCSRTSFPPPVTRTRLAVPLWVFCFGMSSS